VRFSFGGSCRNIRISLKNEFRKSLKMVRYTMKNRYPFSVLKEKSCVTSEVASKLSGVVVDGCVRFD